MKIQDVDLEKIIPYINNPRNNDDAVDALASSIHEFGWKQPIVIDRDYVIVIGHTRYKAAQKLGLKSAPCLFADDLSPSQIKALRLADNKIGEKASWDRDLLKIELENLQESDFDLALTGFDSLELEGIFNWGNLNIDDFFTDNANADNESEPDEDLEDEDEYITCPHCGESFLMGEAK